MGLFGTVTSGRRFEELLPVGAIGLVLWSYVWGLCGALYVGVITALAASVLLGAIAVVLVITRKRRFDSARFFTPAFFVYLALLGFSAYISFGRVAANWDECSHWATVVKAMSYERAFSTNAACHILFRSYPPGGALYQYLYQAANALFTGRIFSEWLLFYAYDALCFALMMPLLRLIDKRPWLYTPLAAILLAALPLCWYDAMYASLYIDGLLAVLAAYALYSFRFGRRGGRFDALACCMALSMLALVKDAGLFFAVMIPLLTFLYDWIAEGRRAWRGDRLLSYLLFAAAIVLAKWSWSREVAHSGVPEAFSAPIDPVQLFRILSGVETGYQHTVLVNYIKKFFSPALTAGPLSISFFMIFVALAAANIVLFFLLAHKNEKKRAHLAVLNPLWIMILYMLGLGVLYLFKFGEYEGVRLASYARYSKVGFIVWSVALAGEWFTYLFDRARRRGIALLISCAAILSGALLASGLGGMLTRQSVRESIRTQAPAAAAAALAEKNAEDGARIYVLTQELDGYEYYQLRYLLYPGNINENGFSIGKPFYEGDVWTLTMSCDSWRDTLIADYDYVLIYRANDFLNREFAALFPAGAKDNTLYRVDKTSGELWPVASRDG